MAFEFRELLRLLERTERKSSAFFQKSSFEVRNTAIFKLLSHRKTREALVFCFCHMHKSEYLVSQTPENKIFAIPDQRSHQELAMAVHQEITYGVRDSYTNADEPTELECFVHFVRVLKFPMSLNSAFSPNFSYTDVSDIQKIIPFIGWIKDEISPENWEHSIVPDMLGLRADEEEIRAARKTREEQSDKMKATVQDTDTVASPTTNALSAEPHQSVVPEPIPGSANSTQGNSAVAEAVAATRTAIDATSTTVEMYLHDRQFRRQRRYQMRRRWLRSAEQGWRV